MLIRPSHRCRHMICILCVYERLFELLSTSLPCHVQLLIIFMWGGLTGIQTPFFVFAFKIIHFTSRCKWFEFFTAQKGLVSSYFCVIAVFLPSVMQIKHDRCVADNYLPLNSCHEWTLIPLCMCLVTHTD